MTERRVKYYLDRDHRFVVEDYNWATPFSNFFPGIAGRWGIPLWIYYVSRAQAVCSMGVRDKDHQILEFLSFNRACQIVPHEGFRTFVRVDGGAPVEPFTRNERAEIQQRLVMSAGELELREENPEAGLGTRVVYYPLVNLPLAGLVRELQLTNTSGRRVCLECLDGVPRVLPYGMNQEHIKFTARHTEAMMGVTRVTGVPLFRLKQTAADRERVEMLSGGTFYVGLMDGAPCREQFVVDPEIIFGDPFQHLEPWGFGRARIGELLARRQLLENATPCAFTGFAAELEPGASVMLRSILGNVRADGDLQDFLRQVTQPTFLPGKRQENHDLLQGITTQAFTASAEEWLDQSCAQSFLDNVMRGGMPAVFRGERRKTAFYVYGRQNGDLERDYHYFVLESTYLSQGTGHYRSIYQNRRTDPWFFPEIEDWNIVRFMNLLQLDGYNPLEVNGSTYTVTDRATAVRLLRGIVEDETAVERLLEMVSSPFTPGDLAMGLEQELHGASMDFERVLGELLSVCEENEIGGLHEGFWVDHWTYNLDAIDVFLMVYPDRLRELLLRERAYTFFDDPDVILPRARKCVLRPDGKVRRYGAVVRDPHKLRVAASRGTHGYRVRTRHGEGEIYRTCLLVKLLCLVANRIATLDPDGIGMDMEADKPGWNDSMNGLPGLFGSALGETLELEKACRFLSESLVAVLDAEVPVYEELITLVEGLSNALERRQQSSAPHRALAFWDESNACKEAYRDATAFGVSGAERIMTGAEIKTFIDLCLGILAPIFQDENRERVMNADGIPYTYFVNEVTAYERADGVSHQGLPLVRPTRFRQRPAPLFLEGPVHYMKVHPEQAKAVHEAVRRSALFDTKLQMYKSCENMEGESYELGRAVGAYPRGWLENESIYLHMEYKYLLEILRSGLVNEFYRDLRTVLIAFQDPAVYGRSTLEGSSFVVSSAYADPTLHGRGFQPRLSGITCEWLHTWILMVAGPKPFCLSGDGALRLSVRPALAAWLFSREPQTRPYHDEIDGHMDLELPADTFAFKFLGTTLVVLHNERRAATYGPGGVQPVEYRLTLRDGTEQTVRASSLGPELAHAVRERRVRRMDVRLG